MDRCTAMLRAAVCLSVFVTQTCCSTSQRSAPASSQEGCLLPQSPEFGSYTSPICEFKNTTTAVCRQVPGTPVPQNWLLLFKCNDGYYLTETTEDKVYVFCINGNWYPKIPACRMPQVHETIFSQHNTSHPLNSVLNTSDTIHQRNKTICGKRNVDTSVSSQHTTTHVPWHVGIYMKNATDHWEQICIGSLISPHIVLTAAHCVFSERIKKVQSPEDFKVALGKYYREWAQDELHAVKSDVREILIPPRYYGKATSYSMDIAVLDLVDSVQINQYIMPVCIDWNHQFTITSGLLGMLAGWSKTGNGTSDDILLYAELPYVDYSHCIYHVPTVFQHYITPDKFCAVVINDTDGTSKMSRYSGGGLTFVMDDLHYLYGITSTKVKGESYAFTFTNITNLEVQAWLHSTKNLIDEKHI